MRRINLLPVEERAKLHRERSLTYALLIVIAIALVLVALYLVQLNMANTKQRELEEINAALQMQETKRAELQPYAEIQRKRTSMTEAATALYDSRICWSSILQQISLVIPTNVQLASLTCVVPETMLPGAAASGGDKPAAASQSTDITFAGTARTHKDVAEFMTRLGLIPQITGIQLTSSIGGATAGSGGTTSTAGGAGGVTFTITASLRPYLTAPPTTAIKQGAGSQGGGQ